MPRKGYALDEGEARDFNRMRRSYHRDGPPKARRSPRRRHFGGGRERPVGDPAFGSPWTIRMYDAVTGDLVRIFDRGRARSSSTPFDSDLYVSTDGTYLYALGFWITNQSSGYLIKWNIETGEKVWYSDDNGLNPPAGSSATTLNRLTGCFQVSSDGALWVASGYSSTGDGFVGRYDVETGIQSHSFDLTGGGNSQLLPCPTAGCVVVAHTTAIGGKFIHILNNTATETHSYSTSITSIEENNGRLYVVSAAALTILNAADLTTIDTRAPPAGHTYIAAISNGTAVWVASSHATTPKYFSYDAANLATENWNLARDTSFATTGRLMYDGTALYDFSELERRINPASGAEVWQGSSLNTTNIPRRTAAALGTDFTAGLHGGNIYVREKSSGALRWQDVLTSAQTVYVDSDDRVFVCGSRSGPL